MANELGRRDLFKGAVAAGLATALWKPSVAAACDDHSHRDSRHGLPRKLQAHPKIFGHPHQEKFWQQVRNAFPLPPAGHYYHYNTGTTGSQPFFSLNNLAVYNLYKSEDPVFWERNLAYDDGGELFNIPAGASGAIGDRQAQIAEMYNANTDEIVLSYDTTDGMIQAFTGVKWNPGDRIVTTNMEHPCGMGAVAWARDVYGVSVSVVDIPFDGGFNLNMDEFLALFQPALAAPLPAGAKQYLVFSQISYKTGFVMPAKELSTLAHSFSNTWVIIDSAHGWGQLVMNCKDIGADFIAGAGHKWLCGGPGTGILYVRNSSGSYPLPDWNPLTEGWGNLFTAPSTRYNSRVGMTSGIQSRGEYNRPAVYAMTDSARLFSYIGIQNVYDRGIKLAAYLQKKVLHRWGTKALWVNMGADQRFKGFVTAFNPFKGNTDSGNFAAQTAAIGTAVSNLQTSINPGLNLTGAPPIYLASRSWPNHNSDLRSNRATFRISTHAMYCSNAETDYVFDQIVKQVDLSGLPQLP
jgi:selenocysteine lyase/cysteine desulfurase